MKEKLYDIYVKDTCVYHSLTKEEFEKQWKSIENWSKVDNRILLDNISFRISKSGS
jgi:hypothetical protein